MITNQDYKQALSNLDYRGDRWKPIEIIKQYVEQLEKENQQFHNLENKKLEDSLRQIEIDNNLVKYLDSIDDER